MSLVGFETKISTATSIASDILLSDGVTIISTNILSLEATVGEFSEKYITLSTNDGSTVCDYTYELLSTAIAPLDITTESLALDSEVLIVKYTPTTTQVEEVILRLTLTKDSVLTIYDVLLNIKSYIASSEFLVTPTFLDFGDIGDLDTDIKTLVLSCSSAAFDISYLDYSLQASNYIELANLKVSLLEYDATSATVTVLFRPLVTNTTTATLQFKYNGSSVSDAVTITGSKASLIPYEPEDYLDGMLAPLEPVNSYIAYKNTSIDTYRIESLTITNDALGEFELTNIDMLLSTTISPDEIIYISLLYTPKKTSYSIPEISINGINFNVKGEIVPFTSAAAPSVQNTTGVPYTDPTYRPTIPEVLPTYRPTIPEVLPPLDPTPQSMPPTGYAITTLEPYTQNGGDTRTFTVSTPEASTNTSLFYKLSCSGADLSPSSFLDNTHGELLVISNNTGIFTKTLNTIHKGSYRVSVHESASNSIALATSTSIFVNGTSSETIYPATLSIKGIAATSGEYYVPRNTTINVVCILPSRRPVKLVDYTLVDVPTVSIYYSISSTSGLTALDLGLMSLTGVFTLTKTNNYEELLTFNIPETTVLNDNEKITITIEDQPVSTLELLLKPKDNTVSYSLETDTEHWYPSMYGLINGEYVTATNIVESDVNYSNVIINLKTKNVPDNTLVPYTITGISEADINAPLVGSFVVINGTASVSITALQDDLFEENELLVLSLDNASSNIKIFIRSTQRPMDGTILHILNNISYLDPQKLEYFYTQGDTALAPYISLINLNTTITYTKNAVNPSLAAPTYALDLNLDISGRTIYPSATVRLTITAPYINISPNYVWVATSSTDTLETAALYFVNAINSDYGTWDYKAIYLGKTSTGYAIRIYVQAVATTPFAISSYIKYPNFYVGTTEIACIMAENVPALVAGANIELITPQQVLFGTSYENNPYTGNSGVWQIQRVFGKYVLLGRRATTVITSVPFYNSAYGLYRVL